MHPSPGALMAIAFIVAVTVRSRRKRMAALAAQWQAFQQHRRSGHG
ncbi:hypothetical protein ABZ235_35815 [Streptomyces canus]